MPSTFPRTRAAAGYIARHARGELARARATVLTASLGVCQGIPAGRHAACQRLREWPAIHAVTTPRRVKGGGQAMDDDTLAVQVRHQPGYSSITVAGDVDIVTAPRLREHLAALAGAGRPVIADLAQVSFIDVAGLRVLATAARQAADSGGSLHVVSAQYLVRRLFTITGLDRQIPLARTRAEALAALQASRDIRGDGNRPPAGSSVPDPDHEPHAQRQHAAGGR